jgi:uncharacterized protein YeaC (DUF1315 family)
VLTGELVSPILVSIVKQPGNATMKSAQFLTLLKVPEIYKGKPLTEAQREKAMNARLIGLGFGVDCPRCGGTGHYSYNAITGTTCFKCDGFRQVAPNLSPELYARVSDAVEAGKLDAHLSSVRARLSAERAAKGATDAVMKAWEAHNLDSVYSWRKAGNEPYHSEIADRVNLPMCEAYRRVSDIAKRVDSLAYKLSGGARNSKPLTDEERAALETERTQALADLITARDEALAEIARTGALIPEIKAKHGV